MANYNTDMKRLYRTQGLIIYIYMLICIMLDPPLVELGLGCSIKIEAGTPMFVADPGVGCQENEHPYVLSYSTSSIHVPQKIPKVGLQTQLTMIRASGRWVNYQCVPLVSNGLTIVKPFLSQLFLTIWQMVRVRYHQHHVPIVLPGEYPTNGCRKINRKGRR